MNKILIVCNEYTKEKNNVLLDCLLQHSAWSGCMIDTLVVMKDCGETAGQATVSLAAIAASDADVIISIDMEGFQNKTLLENFQYNIMTAKQLHLILAKEKWEKYKDAEFAMNLFFYIPSRDSAEEIETHNFKYYSESCLENPKGLIDFIVTDFLKSSQLIQ